MKTQLWQAGVVLISISFISVSASPALAGKKTRAPLEMYSSIDTNTGQAHRVNVARPETISRPESTARPKPRVAQATRPTSSRPVIQTKPKTLALASTVTTPQGYDPVPSDQVNALARRLQLIDALIRRHQRAYDYRLHTVKELEQTLSQLDRVNERTSLPPAPLAKAVAEVPTSELPTPSPEEGIQPGEPESETDSTEIGL